MPFALYNTAMSDACILCGYLSFLSETDNVWCTISRSCYIWAKTDPPCSAVSLRQLSYLFSTSGSLRCYVVSSCTNVNMAMLRGTLSVSSVSGQPHSNWWLCHDTGSPLLAAEHSLCTPRWFGTLCLTTCAHSRIWPMTAPSSRA